MRSVSCIYSDGVTDLRAPRIQAHHILSEVIQGGLVLETNVEEIDRAGMVRTILGGWCGHSYYDFTFTPVQEAAKARKESFASANPLSLGGGGVGARGRGTLQAPLDWLTDKLTGVRAR